MPVHHPHAALSSLTSKSTSASHPSPLVAQQDCSNSGNTSRDGTPTALQQLSSPRTTTGAVVGPFGLAGTTLTYLHTATRVDSSYDNMPASEEPYHPMQNLNPFSLTASDSGQEPGTPRELVANQVGLQASQLVLMKSRVMRWSHLMFMAHEVSLGVQIPQGYANSHKFETIFACLRTAGVKETEAESDGGNQFLFSQLRDLFQSCKSLARTIKLGRHVQRGVTAAEISTPVRDVADMMVDQYFMSFESVYRILHEPTFRIMYRHFWEKPETVTNTTRLTILLVIVIGSSLRGDTRATADWRDFVTQCIRSAQNWLSGPLEKDCLNIAGVQAYCLTLVARELFQMGGDLLWVSTGSLIHRAIQIGLHRDPVHLPPISLLRAEVRRRLWATILEMVAQSSLDSGLPARISYEEFDTRIPSNINDHEIDESTLVIPHHSEATFTSTSMQIMLYQSLPCRLQILQLLNNLRSRLSYPSILALDAKLVESYRKCSTFLKGNGVSGFHRTLLDYMLRRFLLPLHCPFARMASTNPLFFYSRKASLDAAIAIVMGEHDDKFSSLLASGGGMFREGILCAATTISIELIAQVESQRLDGTLLSASSTREPIKQALGMAITLAADRIKQGETNIKTHLFLTMAFAQAEAIDIGASSENAIFQSAKQSLELCQGLLSAQVPNTDLSIYFDDQDDWGRDFDFDFLFADASSFGS